MVSDDAPDQELYALLAKAEAGLQPSPFGELVVTFPISPASIQSAQARKETQRRLIQAELSRFTFLLIGDVQIEVTWHASADNRYESDASPDVDNILKPLLDALSGPNGVLVDDCQVNSIGATVVSTIGSEAVEVRIRHAPDDFVKKSGLLFLDVGRALCVPIVDDLPVEALKAIVQVIEAMLDVRRKLSEMEVALDPRITMIGPRVFHKTRIARNFPCEALAEFKIRLGIR